MLGGIPLVNYAFRAINEVDSIEEAVLFASEPSICCYIQEGIKYKYLKRPQSLDTQQAKVQDLIREFLKLNHDADIVVMFHITSPFLKPETIAECIEKVKSGYYQSAFTAFQINDKCWFKDMPLNCSIGSGSGEVIAPVIVEHSLYVFKREVFETTGQRISDNPYIKVIDHFEGHDIDTPEDFRIAELIVNTGLFELK